MTTAPKKNQKDAAQKSGRGRGAPLGNKNGAGNKGRQRPSGAGRKPAQVGDPRNIKINIAINNAEAAALDAKAAAAGLSRADLIRALISA